MITIEEIATSRQRLLEENRKLKAQNEWNLRFISYLMKQVGKPIVIRERELPAVPIFDIYTNIDGEFVCKVVI